MKYGLCVLAAAALASVSARGQVTIRAADMFNQPGEYYLAYSNDFDPTALVPTPFPVPSGAIGSAGPNQFWDFSKGPTNVVYRFDYLALTNAPATVTADFPQAKIVEQKTDQANGHAEYLFFTQVPGVGRTVYGAYSESALNLIEPSHVFTTPIVDFPDTITYGQEWTTVAVYVNNVSGTDNTDPTADPTAGGSFSLAVQVTQTSDLKVDAWGTIVPPDGLGSFGQGLRVNETVTIDTAADDGSGNFQHIETDTARNYYWLMPGRGIVAALASTQGANGAPVPENFTTATQFWRMFQTNKKATTNPGGNCTDADPVSDLKIRFNAGQVLLNWGTANCATQYRVEYSTNAFDKSSWKPLSGVLTNQLFLLDSANQDHQRFYRVVSMK